jgi:hypothetical protein
MATTIKTGMILIREGALLPESSLIESEPYAPGWRLVKRLDIDGMSQTIGKAGWAFLYMAGVIKTSVFGSDEEKTTRKAVKRVVEHMRSKKFNCLEITQVVAERFLWLPFITVSADPRLTSPNTPFDSHRQCVRSRLKDRSRNPLRPLADGRTPPDSAAPWRNPINVAPTRPWRAKQAAVSRWTP